jgi:sterol-4alpha-carboxylate 3-dehydrogenase (decarboxylating)
MFITNGEPVTARALCLAVWREFGHVPGFEVRLPEPVAWWAGYCAEWVDWLMGTEAVLSRGVVSDVCRDRYVSIAKAKLLLGYRPRVGLEEGLRISCQVRWNKYCIGRVGVKRMMG